MKPTAVTIPVAGPFIFHLREIAQNFIHTKRNVEVNMLLGEVQWLTFSSVACCILLPTNLAAAKRALVSSDDLF